MKQIKDKKLAKQIAQKPISKDEFETALVKMCQAKKPQSDSKPSKT